MIVLVQGPNNSGKSAYAEKRVAAFGGERYYIATMIPFGMDGAARVGKHVKQRAGAGFVTVEAPYTADCAAVPDGCAALIEDAPNLLANNMFERGKHERDVFADIAALCKRVGNAVIVTISDFDDGEYDAQTRAYMAAARRMNAMLSNFADEVVTL